MSRRRRRSLRTRLTLLYAGPFLLCGAILLAVPVLSLNNTVPADPQALPAPEPTGLELTQQHTVLTASAIGLCGMALVSLVLGWLVAGRFLKPLKTITATARDISATSLDRRLDLTGRNELTDLADTLDELFARLQAAFVAQRHFVANASHELRTPLTAQRALLQVTLADPRATTDELRAACEDLLMLGETQERLIAALLTLASSEQPVEKGEPFDLADLARDVVLERGPEAQRRGVHLHTALGAAPVTGNRQLVTSLVANLVDNAVRYNTNPGRVEVSTATDGGRASLTVRNTGPVVPPDQIGRLFEPFQQLDGQRIRHSDGHGLGLAIVRAVATAHGATLVAEAAPGGGLTVQVGF
ncbi:sensor histidine kinase [Rugosimonospora africana]|uniref:histidine kinase n=1 Tax=Rugosimonospora africana TaxID=556532 RepID=A0A8J3QXL4_9ACTN|nr:HAMP domain-containing sensor histidine kinase [Rugosimonospora africana]GIH18406.1 sensor protein CutS [Rugosimonospora africana]